MASDVGLCVVFVSGLSASHKRKGRHAPRCLDFVLHPHPHPRTRESRVPTQSSAISRASHVAPLLRCPRSALSSRAVMRNKTGSVSCAALRSAQAAQTTRHDETDDARERLTSPDIPTHQTAPWSDFGKSRTRARYCRAFLAFHADAEWFTVPTEISFS